MAAPGLIVFDVNETLSGLDVLRGRCREIQAPEELLDSWFSAVLRDGMALAVNGGYGDFKTIAVTNLQAQLAGVESLRDDPGSAAEHVVEGLGELEVHQDVAEGLRGLGDAGVRMVTLTVGSAANSIKLLESAGLGELIAGHFSAGEVQRWKPAPEPYLHVSAGCGVPPERCVLISAHPWDIDGARRAGLRAAWLNREDDEYPEFFNPPEVTAASLPDLAAALL